MERLRRLLDRTVQWGAPARTGRGFPCTYRVPLSEESRQRRVEQALEMIRAGKTRT